MFLEFADMPLTEVEADALLVGRFKGGALPAALHEAIGEAAEELLADLTGKASDEVAVFYPRGAIAARRLLIVGLGKEEALDAETVRRAAAKGLAKAKQLKVESVATTLNQLSGDSLVASEAARAVVEGASLALYHYSLKQKHKEAEEEQEDVKTLRLLGADEAAQRAARLGQAIAGGVRLARDLVNAPPNIVNAPYFTLVAREMEAENPHIKVTVLSLEEARELGMGAFVGVAQGSTTPPQFIILEYRVDELKGQAPVGLVGKGIIFDTGGINLKTNADMWQMKNDMGGGAAVLGTFRALANLPEPLDLPVVGIVPATDNAIGHQSFTPSDVLTSLRGLTIEIQNTDAEGRLVLADALTYIERYQPRAVVDLATLTGAVVVALGPNLAGLFSNDDELAARLQGAATRTSEGLWRLPLPDEYEKLLESTIADMRNTAGRSGGAIGAALFLQRFIGDYPWAHLDIAGTVMSDEHKPSKLPYHSKGASGFGVRLLVDLLRDYAAKG